jgi:hypothetical protein
VIQSAKASSTYQIMDREELIAPCGMDCSLCVAYQSQVYDLKKQGFHRQYCQGCRPRNQNCLHMGDSCDLLRDGRVGFCFECMDFPCQRLKRLDKRYRTKYHMSMIDNLMYLQEHGTEAFLEEQSKRWKCEACGEIICCHYGLCLVCDLDTLRNNKKYRWGE